MPMKNLTRVLQRKTEFEQCQLSNVFRMVSLQTSYIPKRTLGSNLKGFLWALRIHSIYSYLWNQLCLLKVHREREKNCSTSTLQLKSVLAVPSGHFRTGMAEKSERRGRSLLQACKHLLGSFSTGVITVVSCSPEGLGDCLCFEEGPNENSPFRGVKGNTEEMEVKI